MQSKGVLSCVWSVRPCDLPHTSEQWGLLAAVIASKSILKELSQLSEEGRTWARTEQGGQPVHRACQLGSAPQHGVVLLQLFLQHQARLSAAAAKHKMLCSARCSHKSLGVIRAMGPHQRV